MAITRPPPSGAAQPWRDGMPQLPKIPGRVALLLLIPLLVVLGVCYWWFVQRVEVGPGEVLVLVRKVGQALPAEAEGQVVLYPALLEELGEPADSVKYKGVLYDVKPEGRFFYDPFFYERDVRKATFIEQDEIGILIRKYGQPLPPGKIVATELHERGPLAEILRPGRHNINPFAHDVKRVKPVRIQQGSVGVQTLFSGQDPANPNRYVVEKGERGVQPDVLPPGLYYNNPYVRRIDIIDVRSHTLDLRDDDAILFPSKDSFQIVIEGTVEYAVRQDMAPYVMAAIGDHQDVKKKLIIPYMKSFARIEGSKLEAREFISGETRKAFQDRVFEGLREQCSAQGIEIRATLIRRIEPPAEIANPISDRQVAEQQINQYQNEIKLAESQARLVEQEEMQKQNQEIGEADREVVTMTMQAEEHKAVALTEANKRLEVAKLELEAAQETAAALVSRGEAAAEVILLDYEAEAKPLSDAISAFGGGNTYAQYFFYQKLGPALKSVLASTEGPFADIFRSLSKAADAGDANPEPSPE
jgi:regulator of protease activity HflC (stomatin/prohibitin superfamily)